MSVVYVRILVLDRKRKVKKMTLKKWTVLNMKNGKLLEGIVTNETDTHITLYRLPYPVLKKNISSRREETIGVITSQMR
jgi:hypothetical protein